MTLHYDNTDRQVLDSGIQRMGLAKGATSISHPILPPQISISKMLNLTITIAILKTNSL